MTVRFIDTNILLYAISRDRAERAKAQVANELLSQRDLALSVQVLQEFYVQATRASRNDALTHRQASELIHSFTRFAIQETNLALVQAALAAKDRFQISYWDAAIVESARMLNCTELLSEDLNPDQDYAGILVTNPFI